MDSKRGSMQPKVRIAGRVFFGLLTGAVCALPQAYTISAKPGAVNYIEGPVSINGTPLTANAKRVFVNTNDSLETASGSKAEMLLTPGVFVRLGSASSVKMVSPSLADTAIEVTRGEVVVEVSELERGKQHPGPGPSRDHQGSEDRAVPVQKAIPHWPRYWKARRKSSLAIGMWTWEKITRCCWRRT